MTVAVIVLAFIILVGVLLAIPVECTFDLDSDRAPHWQVAVRWLFGMLRLTISGGGEAARAAPRRRKDRARHKRRHPRRLALGDRRVRQRLIGLARAIVHRVEVRNLRGTLRLGLNDPADTGTAFGMAVPVIMVLNTLPAVDVGMDPVFTGPALSGRVAGTIRARPIAVVPQLVGLAILFAHKPKARAR